MNYIGQELEIFANAINWKRYYSELIRPYLQGDVVEVGAGLGVNTQFLKSPAATSWTCLEPDRAMAERMKANFATDPQLADCRIEAATVGALDGTARFDAIAYIDVLEHIPDDLAELVTAATLLRSGGKIVVLAPAHQWLYARFDQAIGHYRRYNAGRLRACTPPGCRLARLAYLDSAGVIASATNRFFLKEGAPSLQQILIWDRLLVPLSKFLDRLTFHTVGKSILAVWVKRACRTEDECVAVDFRQNEFGASAG
jgi:protein-L-isoaspartate O-methyltransferase